MFTDYWLAGQIAEFLHRYRFFITVSPVPVCPSRGSCKVDLNRLPTTGYLVGLLNSFTTTASTLLFHPFQFLYVTVEVHVRGSHKVDLNRLPTTGYLGSLNSLYNTASPGPGPVSS